MNHVFDNVTLPVIVSLDLLKLRVERAFMRINFLSGKLFLLRYLPDFDDIPGAFSELLSIFQGQLLL